MRILLTLILLAFAQLAANAQIKSGSFKIDGDLSQINVSASADFGKFKAEMSAGYNIAEDRIDYYHAELRMAPADIYFALEMSRVSQRPIDEVVKVYSARKANGWGEIAKELGIKPGSAEFHALKNSAISESGKTKKIKGSKGPKGNVAGKGNSSKKQKTK